MAEMAAGLEDYTALVDRVATSQLDQSREKVLKLGCQTYNEAMKRELTIVIEPAEEGGFISYIPEVPGAISQGETMDEAREMVLDALRELDTFRREQALVVPNSKRHVESLTWAT